MSIREDAGIIIRKAIGEVLPGSGVRKALKEMEFGEENLYVFAVGKAAYRMAEACEKVLGDRISRGIVITKYDHVKGELPHFTCYEAGHPTPDENSYKATEEIVSIARELTEQDRVLFLLSGGASALFEKPIIGTEEMEWITDKLLKSGADITEMNTVRKHLSYVKGGRFASICSPAKIDTIVLSDVLGSDLSVIGSGPTCPDPSTGEDAFAIIEKYHISLNADTISLLLNDTPKYLDNVSFRIIGDVRVLVHAAKEALENLGYQTFILTDELNCEARDAGSFLSSIAKTYQETDESIAFIAGGETVVHVKGSGKGGRNQEMALSAAIGLKGLQNTCMFSIGSDGTDGPTDAAGGIVDGNTYEALKNAGISPEKALENNDAYHALSEVQSLIMTGATGTNVNDLSVVLIKREMAEETSQDL